MKHKQACFPAHHQLAIRTRWVRLAMLLRLAIVVPISLGGPGTAMAAGPIGLLDAVRQTLAKNPDIQLQTKQVEISQGALQQAVGQFDPALSLTTGRSRNNTPLSPYDSAVYLGLPQLTTKTTTYNVAMNEPLRNGIVLSETIGATSTTGTIDNIENLPAQNQGNVNFSILVPLLKGSGEAAAGEVAAKLQWEASRQDLRLTISKSVLNTVTAYWGLLAASKSLDIARKSEVGARQTVDNTRKLIAADVIPAADLNLVSANLLEKTASRIAAEQALFDARQSLGQAIGLPYQQITALEASDGFPPIATAELSALENQRTRLIDLAMKCRPDLKAARLREDSARTLTSAAQANLKPQLDVTVSAGYTGLAQGGGAGAWEGLTQNRGGGNIGVNVAYQWPFDNNDARGRYQQQAAAYDQSTIQVASVERSIGVDVESALLNLTHSALQLDKSQAATDLYRVSVKNEETKYKLGASTIIDVLTVTDQLLNARLSNIAYRLNTLIALARLNFATGTLLTEDHARQSIHMEQLIGVPKLD